jgi:hypothetical protein
VRAARQSGSCGFASVAAVTAITAAVIAGCGARSLPSPVVGIACAPGSIAIEVTNVGDVPARYTIYVEIRGLDIIENEMWSTDDVGPGATATISDHRPSENETCTVVKVRSFPSV